MSVTSGLIIGTCGMTVATYVTTGEIFTLTGGTSTGIEDIAGKSKMQSGVYKNIANVSAITSRIPVIRDCDGRFAGRVDRGASRDGRSRCLVCPGAYQIDRDADHAGHVEDHGNLWSAPKLTLM